MDLDLWTRNASFLEKKTLQVPGLVHSNSVWEQKCILRFYEKNYKENKGSMTSNIIG